MPIGRIFSIRLPPTTQGIETGEKEFYRMKTFVGQMVKQAK
jgi:hypothetical protein